MSSLCYCCCRLTPIRSWTKGSVLIQSRCEKYWLCLKRNSIIKQKNAATNQVCMLLVPWRDTSCQIRNIYRDLLAWLSYFMYELFSFHKLNLFFLTFKREKSCYVQILLRRFHRFGCIFPLRDRTLEQAAGIFAITFIWNGALLCTLKTNFGQWRFDTTAEFI